MLKGEVKITGTSAAPTAAAGMLHYDTDDNILYIYNGSEWVALYS